VLSQLKELSKHRYVPAYDIAMVYLGLGQKDHAYQLHFTEIPIKRRVAALGSVLSTLPYSCSFSFSAHQCPSL
jgi:hypothetical protein